MNAKRLTRREALAAGAAAMVFAGCTNRPTAEAEREEQTPGGDDGAAGNIRRAPDVGEPIADFDRNGAWIGMCVLPKAYHIVGYPQTAPAPPPRPGEPPQTWVSMYNPSFDVKGEDATRVEVIDYDGRLCWVDKALLNSLAGAIEQATKALANNSRDTFARASRGWAQYLLGKNDLAVADLNELLKLIPPGAQSDPVLASQWADGLIARGLIHAELGEFARALADLDSAIQAEWSLGIAFTNRGYTFELKGEYAKALADYDQATQRPAVPVLAQNNKAWILATCPQSKFRDGAEAVKLMNAVCERTQNREGMYLDTLAAAYAEAGKFDDAVKAQEKALEDKYYAIRYGEGGRQRLQLYKDKKPFRTEPVKQ